MVNCSFCNEPHLERDCKYNPRNAFLNQIKCVICLKTDHLGKNCIFNPSSQVNIAATQVDNKTNPPKEQVTCQYCNVSGHIASLCNKIIGHPNKNNNNNNSSSSYCSRFRHYIDDCRKKIIDEALQQKN